MTEHVLTAAAPTFAHDNFPEGVFQEIRPDGNWAYEVALAWPRERSLPSDGDTVLLEAMLNTRLRVVAVRESVPIYVDTRGGLALMDVPLVVGTMEGVEQPPSDEFPRIVYPLEFTG